MEQDGVGLGGVLDVSSVNIGDLGLLERLLSSNNLSCLSDLLLEDFSRVIWGSLLLITLKLGELGGGDGSDESEDSEVEFHF